MVNLPPPSKTQVLIRITDDYDNTVQNKLVNLIM